MNLDEFKPLVGEVKAPASAPSSAGSLDDFVAPLRAKDQADRRRLLGLAVVYVGLGVALVAAGKRGSTGTAVVGTGILLSAFYFSLKGRWLGRVNYAAPAREFLAAAASRYRFWTAKDALCIVPLLLLVVLGGGLAVWAAAQRHLSHGGGLIALGCYAAFVSGVILFGFAQGRKLWKREKGALFDEILMRQRALENG